MEQELRILEYMRKYNSTIDERTALIDIQRVLMSVRGYINNEVVPVEVESSIAFEILGYYRDVPLGVVSVKEGDTTLTFAREMGYKAILEALKATLYPYRKVI